MAYKTGILFSNGIFRSPKKNTLSPTHSGVCCFLHLTTCLPRQSPPQLLPLPDLGAEGAVGCSGAGCSQRPPGPAGGRWVAPVLRGARRSPGGWGDTGLGGFCLREDIAEPTRWSPA